MTEVASCIIDSSYAARGITGRAYNRTAHLEGRAKMMQKWADYLGELKDHAK